MNFTISDDPLAEMAKTLPRGNPVNFAGYDYGIHFLAADGCVRAVRQFFAGQKQSERGLGSNVALAVH